jgi:uncharacterized protein (TIGR04255 family)
MADMVFPYPRYPKLSKAPIVEAVVELKVRTHKPVEVAALAPIRGALGDRFSVSRDIHQVQAQIEMRSEGPQQAFRAGLVGLRLESSDRGFVVMARIDGVSISRLPPYDTWEGLRDEARAVWTEYARAVDPVAITRIGVRFINRIELPQEPIDFDEVLTAGPKIPEPLPQELTEFFTRVVVPIPEKDATVAIVQTIEPAAPAAAGHYSPAVVLDIDAFVERAFEVDDPGTWAALDSLRDVKNMAFFNSITKKTLETLR